MSLQTTTLGAGCFWCVEAVYQNLAGVQSSVSGYMGGPGDNPNYRDVCGGQTGHAEVLQVQFDPSAISFADLLHVFWRTHDPTTLNRQGNDQGTQYRSAIFFHDEEQQQIAIASKTETDSSGLWADPIVTEISAASTFWPAEDYHQNYYNLNPNQPYCMMIINPKLNKFRKEFADRLKAAG
jgi:peptide-methionine (S)-S-oxide reductase